jgi:hypothetical protein
MTAWSSAGNDGGLLRARGVGQSRPAARERSGRNTDAGRLTPLPVVLSVRVVSYMPDLSRSSACAGSVLARRWDVGGRNPGRLV